MTDTAKEPKPKRHRRPKGQSMPVMKELLGLMDQRTALMNQIRIKRMELAQLEISMQALATEIQWRANIFNMTPKPETTSEATVMTPGSPFSVPGVQFAPASPAPMIPNEAAPAPAGSFNRGSAAMDLARMI